MIVKTIAYSGWKNCIHISNEKIQLVVTTDIGPRVIFAGLIGGENLFYENELELGISGGNEWHIYGGHRLWQAPEDQAITYVPDNFPVTMEQTGETLRFTAPVEQNGVQKVIEISFGGSNHVVLNHHFLNHSKTPIHMAPWALSVMRQGGVAVIPHHLEIDSPTQLLPTHAMALWGYTTLKDPRWTWGDKYILLKQDPNSNNPQKIGLLNRAGWAAYAVNHQLFVKRFVLLAGKTYPDFGCNFEAYTNHAILELESLGPMQLLEPGLSLSHQEEWFLYDQVAPPLNDKDVIDNIEPLLM